MRRLTGVNQKAGRVETHLDGEREARAQADSPGVGEDAPGLDRDVVGLRSGPPDGPHVPLGCTLMFSPGWEVDSSGSTAGLCQPVERDLFDCHLGCFWPAQVPDQMNHSPDWTSKCAAAQKDWRNVDVIFP
ncbi:MAG: quinohemoprotein amine dehydrogenase [Gemmatimonadales bacterium]|nr:MAG: quinohemoprotein amine dehydrogenase [Gemmatimonadales bacterium]